MDVVLSSGARGRQQRPKVSVVLPVYNAAENLQQCLDSVLGQTLREIEVICVDDGSTDNSLAILREYEAADARVVVLQQANAGAGAARNAGIAAARGEYFSFLDADDFFNARMLERAYACAAADAHDIFVFRCDNYYPSERYESCLYSIRENLLPAERPFAGTDIQRDVFKAFVGWAWDKLFRADFVRENGLRFQELRTTNDMRFVFSAIVRAQRIGATDELFAHHRRAEGSLSVTREQSWGCFYEALCGLRDQLHAWGLYERFEQDFINYALHFSLWNLRTLADPTKGKLRAKMRREWARDLGLTAHGRDYFYDQGEFDAIRRAIRLWWR